MSTVDHVHPVFLSRTTERPRPPYLVITLREFPGEAELSGGARANVERTTGRLDALTHLAQSEMHASPFDKYPSLKSKYRTSALFQNAARSGAVRAPPIRAASSPRRTPRACSLRLRPESADGAAEAVEGANLERVPSFARSSAPRPLHQRRELVRLFMSLGLPEGTRARPVPSTSCKKENGGRVRTSVDAGGCAAPARQHGQRQPAHRR